MLGVHFQALINRIVEMSKKSNEENLIKKVPKRKGGTGYNVSAFTKEEVEAALRASYGIMAQAGRKLIQANGKPLGRAQTLQLVDRYKLRHVIDECNESFVDLAETAIAKKIAGGDTSSIIFTLKTKGKNRGWKEEPKSNITFNTRENLEALFNDDDAKPADKEKA